MMSHAPSGDRRRGAHLVPHPSPDVDPDGVVRCPIELSPAPVVAGSDLPGSRLATSASLLGELTHCTKQEVVDVLQPYCEEALTVDLSRVTYFDAGGITALLTLRGRCRAGGNELVVDRPTPHVRWVLTLVGLDGELLGRPGVDDVVAHRPPRALLDREV